MIWVLVTDRIKIMALKKKSEKDDVRFIDPVTMQVRCSYNQCYQKFVESSRPDIKTPFWGDTYHPIKSTVYFHKCSECGMSFSSNEDKSRSIRDYNNNLFEDHVLTPEENKQVIATMNRIIEVANDPEKIKNATALINKLVNSNS